MSKIEEAAQAVAELDPACWGDIARHFTCEEADVLARFFDATDAGITSAEFLTLHAEGDNEPEDHHAHLREDRP